MQGYSGLDFVHLHICIRFFQIFITKYIQKNVQNKEFLKKETLG